MPLDLPREPRADHLGVREDVQPLNRELRGSGSRLLLDDKMVMQKLQYHTCARSSPRLCLLPLRSTAVARLVKRAVSLMLLASSNAATPCAPYLDVVRAGGILSRPARHGPPYEMGPAGAGMIIGLAGDPCSPTNPCWPVTGSDGAAALRTLRDDAGHRLTSHDREVVARSGCPVAAPSTGHLHARPGVRMGSVRAQESERPVRPSAALRVRT